MYTYVQPMANYHNATPKRYQKVTEPWKLEGKHHQQTILETLFCMLWDFYEIIYVYENNSYSNSNIL